jgi:hypothetical protein
LQASLVSARLVFALLVALFSSGGPGGESSSVLVDRISGGAVVGSYVATEEAGAVALVQVEPQGPPESLAILERVDGASHLFAEIENERVYSLEEFFQAEYTLSESISTTMELPSYPEAMIRRAAGGSDGAPGGAATAADGRGGADGEETLPGVPEDRAPEDIPTSSWRFLQSGELLYLFPGESDEILVVRSTP